MTVRQPQAHKRGSCGGCGVFPGPSRVTGFLAASGLLGIQFQVIDVALDPGLTDVSAHLPASLG